MKQIALLAIIVGLSAVSMAAIYASDLDPTSLVVANSSSDKVGMYGHIEFVQADSSGNIISYYQTDNFVTNQGAECSAAKLFDLSETVGTCDTTGTLVNEFLNIRLGNGVPIGTDETRTALITDMGGFKVDSDAVFGNLGGGTVDVTVATETPFDFTTGGGNVTLNVFEAGLFDETTGGNAFAIQNTTSGANPGIDVNDGDTLAVTWTITVG